MRILILEVAAPCDFINSNDRRVWQAKAKLTKAWREAGWSAAVGHEPFAGKVRIVAHIWKARGGRWDPANYWPTVKACCDGIVQSGLLSDDDWEHVEGPDMRRGGKGDPRLVITIEEAS